MPGLAEIGRRTTGWAERRVPDPFVLALLLTLATLVAGAAWAGPGTALRGWIGGFFDLLAFGMRMCLILVTGHALAISPPFRRLLGALADRPRTGPQAVWLVATVAIALGLVNWGLGLIFGALLVREVGVRARERGVDVHYPLLAAAGYLGLVAWHGGLSGSAPLDVATPGHRLEATTGIVEVARTLWAPANLAVAAALLVVLPLLFARLHPSTGTSPPPPPEPTPPPPDRLGGRLDDARWVALAPSAVALGTVAWLGGRGELGLTLDSMIVVFLFAGLALHGTPRRYAAAIGDAARGASGMVLQFPFYAGILGVLSATGLLAAITRWTVETASPTTYPLIAFASAAVLNFFVPSGGGQWALQGPIVADAGRLLGVPPETGVMAIAYGDQLTNMAQPFWALPLLAIARIEARAILGYTLLAMAVAAAIFVTAIVAIGF